MKEKKLRIEDALSATKAAVEEGIVAGGGTALVNVMPRVQKISRYIRRRRKTRCKNSSKSIRRTSKTNCSKCRSRRSCNT